MGDKKVSIFMGVLKRISLLSLENTYIYIWSGPDRQEGYVLWNTQPALAPISGLMAWGEN